MWWRVPSAWESALREGDEELRDAVVWLKWRHFFPRFNELSVGAPAPDAALVSDMGGLDAGPSGVVDASMDTRLTGPDQGRVSSDVGEPEMTSEDGDANGGCSAQGAPSQLLPLLGVLLIACRRR